MIKQKTQIAVLAMLLSFFFMPLNAEAVGEKVKVVSYNIQGGCSAPMDEGSYNIDKTIQVLKNAQADIILLQESQQGSTKKGACTASFSGTQTAKIATELGMQHYHYGTLGILSKHPFKANSGATFQNKSASTRRYTRSAILIPGDIIIYVYNAHLDRFDKSTRKKQIAELSALAEAESGPTIAGGDFNECAINTVTGAFSGFSDPTGIAHTFTPKEPSSASTIKALVDSSSCPISAGKLQEKLDYLLGDKIHWGAQEGGVLTSAADTSDHYPIYAVFVATEAATPGKALAAKPNNPNLFKDSSLLGDLGDAFQKRTLGKEAVQDLIQTPVPRIKIPGLSFSEAKVEEVTDEDGNKQLYVSVPFLGEYMSAVYRYSIIFVSILSVAILIVSGIQWILRGGSTEKQTIISRIQASIIGLIIAVSSYLILYSLNPDLVNFSSLEIPFVQPVDYRPEYAESEVDDGLGVGGLSRYVNGKTMSASDKCLEEKFFPGRIGQRAETEKVEMFGLGKITVNKHAAAAFSQVSTEVLALAQTDKEISGYLQYMKDFKDKKVPDLLGTMDGKGMFSVALSRIGYARRGANQGQPITCLRCDMHATGLALDIMTRSNWDVRWGGTSRGAPATRVCSKYKDTLEKMKTGHYGAELQKDPYNMFDRLSKKIDACLNKFNNGTEPYTSLPQGIIDAFERNGFYWGGWGWGKLRSDSMHFEYLGECANSKGGNKGGPAAKGPNSILEKDLMCCQINATLQQVTVQSQAECSAQSGTVISSGSC